MSTDRPKFAAAYVRMSDDSQDLSPEQQWSAIEARAKADGYALHPDFKYMDAGISGWDAKARRPQFDRLNRDLERGHFAHAQVHRIYVWKMSRLARQRYVALKVLADFERANVDLISLSEAWGNDPKARKMIQTITSLFDEMYSDNVSEDVQRGMKSQATKGYWPYGSPPYGFVLDHGDGDSPRLAVDPVKGPIVRRIFGLSQGGDGSTRIASILTAEGVPPPGRAAFRPAVWRKGQVTDILQNPAYWGAVTWRARVVCEGAHPALVTYEVWADAQSRREARRKVPANPLRKSEHGLFTPWLRCPACGGSVRVGFGGLKPKRLFYYQCQRRVETAAACDGFSVRTDRLDPIVMARIEADVLTADNVRALIAATLSQLRAAGPPEDERATLRAADEDVTRRIGRLVALAAASDDDLAEVTSQLGGLRAERDHVRRRLALTPAPAAIPRLEDVDVDGFRERVRTAWSAATVFDRRQALAGLLERIEISEDGVVTVHYAWREGGAGYHRRGRYGDPSGRERRPRRSSVGDGDLSGRERRPRRPSARDAHPSRREGRPGRSSGRDAHPSRLEGRPGRSSGPDANPSRLEQRGRRPSARDAHPSRLEGRPALPRGMPIPPAGRVARAARPAW